MVKVLPHVTSSRKTQKGATIFGYQVKDPERFGVVEFDKQNVQFLLKKSLSNQSLISQ